MESRWAPPSVRSGRRLPARVRAPRGVNVFMRGQVPAFEETLSGLRTGLLLSVVVIFLLLAANFQSFRLAIAVISPVPAVICGVLLILLLTRHHVECAIVHGRDHGHRNLRRERHPVGHRSPKPRDGTVRPSHEACLQGARGRLRAILMTALAMIAGMIPMALGTGERAQTAPLGRAVIGGLFIRHTGHADRAARRLYAPATARQIASPTLDPDDPLSTLYERSHVTSGSCSVSS